MSRSDDHRPLFWLASLGLVASSVGLALGACVSAGFTDGQFLCDPEGGDDQCPDGQQCAPDGRCRASWGEPSGGGGTGGSASGTGGGGGGPVGGSGGSCQPKLCAEFFPACAGILDSCTQQPMDCSDACPAPSTCGGAGDPTQCGCAPTTLSETHTASVVENHPGGTGYAWTPSDGSNLVQVLATNDGDRARPADNIPHNTTMRRLNLRDFKFTIPDDATIKGVRFSIEKGAGYPTTNVVPVYDTFVHVTYNGGEGVDRGLWTTPWPNPNDGIWHYGNDHDMWGIPTLTPAMVKDPLFGVRLRCRTNATPAHESRPRIDWAQLEVFYEPHCPAP